MRRVVISGLGAISPHGLGAPAFWNALLEGKSSTSTISRFDAASFDCQVAGIVPAFKTTEYVPKSYRKATKIMARDIELAVVAADFAVRDARLITKGIAEAVPADKLAAEPKPWHKVNPARIGCNIGAGLICADLDELTRALAVARNDDNTLNLAKWGKSDDPNKTSGMENLTPLWLLKYLPNMLACHVSIIHDTQGPSNTITCAQASAGLALAEAARTIMREEADMALVGGCESKVNPMALMRWSLFKERLVTDSNANPGGALRPYDQAAGGTVLAEGGAVLVIEEYEHAKARGATIYAEVVGIGASCGVGDSLIDPDPTGEAPAVAIKKALKDAKASPSDVGLVVPTAYGIPHFDQADAKAFQLVFGDHLSKTKILPARAGIGDCGAGAQALDLVAAALALHTQTIPAAVNTKNPIANLPVAREKSTTPFTHAVVLSTAVGGQNSAIVLKKVD